MTSSSAVEPPPHVLEQLAAPVAAGCAAQWGATGDPVRVRVMENAVYRIQRDGQPLILRLTHHRHRSGAQLDAELAWMRRLVAGGAAVVAPVPSAAGSWWIETSTTDGPLRAAVFTHADGAPLRPGGAGWDATALEAWGRLFAHLHQDARTLPPAMRAARGRWQDDRFWRSIPALLGGTPAADEWAQATAWLEARCQEEHEVGLIHQDLTHGNLVVHARGVTAFDFDDCLVHLFAMDVAVALHLVLMGIPGDAALATAARAFLTRMAAGYRSIARMPDAWTAWMPGLLRIRDLLSGAWCQARGLPTGPGSYAARILAQVAACDRYASLGPLPW